MRMGFKVPVKANLYFHNILFELMSDHKVDMISNYPSLREYNVLSDFRYIVIERVQNKDYDFNQVRRLIMNAYFWIRKIGMTDVNYLGLDSTNVSVEEVPLLARSEIIYSGKEIAPVSSDSAKIKINDLKFKRVKSLKNRRTPPENTTE
jgi:KUP system potassium uptake protein